MTFRDIADRVHGKSAGVQAVKSSSGWAMDLQKHASNLVTDARNRRYKAENRMEGHLALPPKQRRAAMYAPIPQQQAPPHPYASYSHASTPRSTCAISKAGFMQPSSPISRGDVRSVIAPLRERALNPSESREARATTCPYLNNPATLT